MTILESKFHAIQETKVNIHMKTGLTKVLSLTIWISNTIKSIPKLVGIILDQILLEDKIAKILVQIAIKAALLLMTLRLSYST